MIETGIYFGDIHSFTDLNLVLSKVDIPPAIPKTDYVDIPGGDGSIDMTEALGEVRYNDRDCKFTFAVFPAEQKSFEEKKTEVANALNGKRCNIILDKDPEYHYSGRLTVNEWNQDKNLKQIVVTARVAPYKLKNSDTIVVVDLSSTLKNIVLTNNRKSVVPIITNSHENAVIGFNGATYTLKDIGAHRIMDICLTEGDNIFVVSGQGTLIFKWQEGAL